MATQITKQQKMACAETLKAATLAQVPLLKSMGIREEAFSRVLVNALMREPKLALCTKDSLFKSVFDACDMGLLPDGRHGAIVSIKKNNVATADFWPMVGGLLTCVRRELSNVAIQAHNVFKGDEWEDRRGTRPELTHIVNDKVDRLDWNNMVCAYATVHFAGNDVAEFEVMYMPELERFIKNNRGPWSTHRLEMFRVRPLKRVLKRLPLSGGLMAKLNRADDDFDDQPMGEVIDGEAVDVTDRPAGRNPPPPARTRERPPPDDTDDDDDDDDLTVQDETGNAEPETGDMF